jgi:ribosomal protein L14E/L6E/L27E
MTKHLTFHPLANVLPLIEGKAYAELVNSIKAHGLLDPIAMLDDMILDGRNRYRACCEVGIEPRTELFTGPDPVAFVTAKNLNRRHLTTGQKAMALEKYATLSNGQNKPKAAGVATPAKSCAEIAKMAGIGKQAVSDAKTIRVNGTQEEVDAVCNGAPISPVADKVRARRDGKPDFGCRIKVHAGSTVTEMARKGIALQKLGGVTQTIAKKIGLSLNSYVAVRDVILLSERDDLNEKDAAIVAEALREIDETRRVRQPWKKVQPIVRRVWGTKGNRLKRVDRRRLQHFTDAVTFLHHTCETAVDIVIPHITHAEADIAISQLSKAEASLRELRSRIREVQYE